MIRIPVKYLLVGLVLLAGNSRAAAAGKFPVSFDRFSVSFFPVVDSSAPRYAVGDIAITGNRVTRSYIIERELPFHRGDSLSMSQIVAAFTESRQRLVATRLFNDVKVYLKSFRGSVVDVQIELKERWYIFPLPYIRPVDRNLTAWADQHYSLKRFDYGLKYSQYNFTGRNDYLRIWLLTGYTRQVELAYDRPNIGPNPKHGFGGGILYAGQHELNVGTFGNKQSFVNRDSITTAGKYMREQWNASLRYYFRPALRTNHYVRISFHHVNVDSNVLLYNPHYFLNNHLTENYPELSYSFRYNVIDYIPYPTKGFLVDGGLMKRGFRSGMDMWQLNGRVVTAVPLLPKWIFVTEDLGLLRVPFRQPFYNQQLLGYDNYYMRGLERYVVDGVGAVVSRNTLLRDLTRFNLAFLRGTSHDYIPFHIYAKAYVDLGYVYNKYYNDNSLVNRALYTGGIGVDIITFYDLVFRAEFSINQLGEKGLFFHIRNDF